MKTDIDTAREHFIHGLSRVSDFWGFPRAMGAIYGAIYLSPAPITLDELVAQVGVSKGAVSTNVRNLERLRMIHKHVKVGDRKDYYTAETDFWKIVKSILRERENTEFDHALCSIDESLDIVRQSGKQSPDRQMALFFVERMKHMKDFFRTLDNIVATILALDDLREGAIAKILKRGKR